jgi:hypothetical protein
MRNDVSFRDYAIAPCGTLNLELNYLKVSGFLDARKLYVRSLGGMRFLENLRSSW